MAKTLIRVGIFDRPLTRCVWRARTRLSPSVAPEEIGSVRIIDTRRLLRPAAPSYGTETLIYPGPGGRDLIAHISPGGAGSG